MEGLSRLLFGHLQNLEIIQVGLGEIHKLVISPEYTLEKLKKKIKDLNSNIITLTLKSGASGSYMRKRTFSTSFDGMIFSMRDYFSDDDTNVLNLKYILSELVSVDNLDSSILSRTVLQESEILSMAKNARIDRNFFAGATYSKLYHRANYNESKPEQSYSHLKTKQKEINEILYFRQPEYGTSFLLEVCFIRLRSSSIFSGL